MGKTLIAVPCMDAVPAKFAYSLAMLRKVGECALTFEIGSLIYTSRDNIAKKALSMDADFILWLDSDMEFAPDLLERLMAHMEKDESVDMVTGLYFRRVPPFTPVLFDRLDVEKRGDRDVCLWTEYKKLPKKKPFEVGGCGFGCVLMRTDVILNVQGKFGRMFTPMASVGEDLAFCWRARQCGHKIICDPAVTCGHVGNVTITKEFFDNYNNAAKRK